MPSKISFITVTENTERRCYISSTRFIAWKLLQHKNDPNHWSWDKKYNKYPKTKKIMLWWNNK